MGIACMESPDCWWCVVLYVRAGPWICPSDFQSQLKKMSLLFAQIKDAVALCELFNWLEKEVGS